MVALVLLGRCDHSQPVANPAMQTVRVCVSLCVCVCLMIGKTCHGCLHNFPHRTLRNPCSNLCITLKLLLLLLLKLKLTLSSSDAAAASSAAFLCLCVKRFSICQTKTWLSQQWNTSPPCPQHPTPPLSPTTPRQTNITKLVSHRCLGYCTLHQLPFD